CRAASSMPMRGCGRSSKCREIRPGRSSAIGARFEGYWNMATVVLTAVGSVFGGPIGAALGGLVGSAFDHGALFKPKERQGPRLQDLHIQTSTYGTQIPKLFGTMRVAGTVIWATDLRETKKKSGGGKGQPSVTTYSYSASFAVALSARVVRSVK